MNLTSLSLSSAASLYSTSAVSNRVNDAFDRSKTRLAGQAESTRVQLSAYGQLKSATAQLETASQGLRDSKALSTVDGLTKAVQGFASAVNARNTAVAQAGAGSGPGSARQAGLETRRALEGVGGSNRDALKQIGVNVASNGSVSVDTKALQTAFAANPDKVRQTLDKVGLAVGQQSTQQLSGAGSVASSVSRLTEKLSSVEQRQAAVQTQQDESQRQVAERDKQTNQAQLAAQQAFNFSGTAAYNRVFTG